MHSLYCAAFHSVVAAEAQPKAPIPDVLVYLEEVGSATALHWCEQTFGAKPCERLPQRSASSPEVLDPLRFRLINGYRRTLGEESDRCWSEGATFASELTLFSEEVQGTDLAAGDRAFVRMLNAFPCSKQLITSAELVSFRIDAATLRLSQRADDEAVALLQEAILLEPSSPAFEAVAGSQLNPALVAARSGLSERKRVPVQIDLERLAPLRLAIDGKGVDSASLRLPTGLHFVQLLLPDDTLWVSRVVELKAPYGRQTQTWPPADFIPPTREMVRDTLEREANAGLLSPLTTSTLQELAGQGYKNGLMLLARKPESSDLRSWRFTPDVVSGPSLEADPVLALKRHWKHLAIASGACVLVSGGLSVLGTQFVGQTEGGFPVNQVLNYGGAVAAAACTVSGVWNAYRSSR